LKIALCTIGGWTGTFPFGESDAPARAQRVANKGRGELDCIISVYDIIDRWQGIGGDRAAPGAFRTTANVRLQHEAGAQTVAEPAGPAEQREVGERSSL
jgi:hypothetical protein